MCLIFDRCDIAYADTQRKVPGKVIRYKVLSLRSKKYETPYQLYPINDNLLKSDRESIELDSVESGCQLIDKGIHVFTTKNQAKAHMESNYIKNPVIIEVECDNADLVMSSEYDNEEVYMKVKLRNLYGIKYYWMRFLNFIDIKLF